MTATLSEMRDATYRELFGDMPPLTHDKDPARSEVVAHISRKLDCDTPAALVVFNTIRHARKRIILHDNARRVWYGEQNINTPDAVRLLRKRCDALEEAARDAETRIAALEETVIAMRKWSRKVEAALADKK